MGMMDEFKKELRDQLWGRSIKKCSTWAERRRIMSKPFPGPYTFRFHPWCRELHDTQASWNVTMKSAQAGFTEVGINIALYTVDVLKNNVLYVLPTYGNACDFSTGRFSPALSMSPYLKQVFTQTNRIGLKMAGNTALYIRGSGGDSNLKSIPASVVILDELDEMDQSQIELAMQRLKGQPHKKIWFISTPTTPDHGVSLEYENSTKEHFRYKCPGCGKMDEFVWPDSVEICGTDITDPDTAKSRFKCQMCKYVYHQFQDETGFTRQDEKLEMLQKGFWEPSVSGRDPDRRGFNINQLYSYTVSAREIVIDYFKAQLTEYANQEFHKSVLGEPFIGTNSRVTEDMLKEAKKEYQLGQLSIQPRQTDRMITMGIDQGDWNHYVVAEWFFPGLGVDLNTEAECRILQMGKFWREDWKMMTDRLMHEWRVLACVVDADPNSNQMRAFARNYESHVWLCRYREGKTGSQMTIVDDGTYAPEITVDRTHWFDSSVGRFFVPGRIEIPYDTPNEFNKHIKALYRMYKEDRLGNPQAIYLNNGDDHYAHALNYAEIALPCAASITTYRSIEAFL